MIKILMGVFFIQSFISPVFADIEKKVSETPSETPKNIKYKSSGDVNFEEMLIQGQIKRPELSVVTGNTSKGSDGLLRLRDHFIDRIQMDGGEEL